MITYAHCHTILKANIWLLDSLMEKLKSMTHKLKHSSGLSKVTQVVSLPLLSLMASSLQGPETLKSLAMMSDPLTTLFLSSKVTEVKYVG